KEKAEHSHLSHLLRSLDPSAGSKSKGLVRSDTGAIIFVAILLLFVFAVFLGKAFHIDDPLFIWAARQIQTHPANPYDFSVNWYGAPMPISDVTKNPPLASYYMALAAAIFGWSEPAVHLAFVAAAIAVVIGTYLLAARLCSHPLLGTVAGILT